MTVSLCIPDDVLRALQHGTISNEEAASWETHLLSCPQCLERTRNLQSAQTVGQAHRGEVAESLPSGAEELIQRLVNRAHVEALAALSVAATSAEAPTVRPETEAATSVPPAVNVPSLDLAPGMLLGPYRILAKLGEGGMGAVYKATHTKLDKIVAVKVLSTQVTKQADAVVRFEREMRAVGKLNHPHIVQAHDAGEINGLHYLAMEYVEGTDLQQLVKARGKLSVVNACKAIRQTALALAAAHGAGLVHRDIKPSNILVGKNGQVKLLDLGLALLAEDTPASAELTTAGQAFGTPDYMAPEQWEDAHAADARTDLYALGCTLYFLLVGHPPYGIEQYRTAVGKMKAHVTAAIPSLQAARPDVPAELAAIYQKLLAKPSEDRYQTAAQLVEAITPFTSTKVPPPVVTPAAATTLDPVAEVAATAAFIQAPTLETAVSGGGQRGTPRKIALAAGGAAAMLLLGVIVITILNKDGSKTQVEVPGDARQVDITQDGKTLVKVTPGTTTPTSHGTAAVTTGWHGWPADAPKPAIAPFDAAQAKKHQEEWAVYLKVPVEYTNSIGMKFRLIPPGEFLMGSTAQQIAQSLNAIDEHPFWPNCIKSEAPRHRVVLTTPLYLSSHEVTQDQFHSIMGANPSHHQPNGPRSEFVIGQSTGDHPVESMTWHDAQNFCAKLSDQELLSRFRYGVRNGELAHLGGVGYRLPSEAEWEFGCRAGTVDTLENDDQQEGLPSVAWFSVNSGNRTHAVGEMKPNPFGFYDMQGNVWEWTQDGWSLGYYAEPAALMNPLGVSTTNPHRVFRGGSFAIPSPLCRSSSRNAYAPDGPHFTLGFRVAITVDGVRQQLKSNSAATLASHRWHGWPADAPPPAIAPFDAAQAKKHQEEWAAYLKVPVEYTNSLDMKFRLIPPGEFTMGSTPEEIEAALKGAGEDKQWQEFIKSEAPQHKVILTQPIYLGVNEVTQAEYEKVTGTNPSHFSPKGMGKEAVDGIETAGHPVEMVSWNDAAEFCSKLSTQEKLKPFYFRAGVTITPLDGTGYRVPSEAHWEFACRAGTITKYWISDNDKDLVLGGWFGQNSGGRTHAAGELKANPFGLADIYGNVWEWVQDGWDPTNYDPFQDKPAINPKAPFDADSQRIVRGADWRQVAIDCRSSSRWPFFPAGVANNIGFRVSLPVDAVRQALKVNGPALPKPVVGTPSASAETGIDFAAERKAAEIALAWPAATLELRAAQGQPLEWDHKVLPAQPFTIRQLALQPQTGRALDDDALAPFMACRHIEQLQLAGSQLSPEGFKRLITAHPLQMLRLSESSVGGEEMRSVLSHSTLQEFGGVGCKFADDNWDALPRSRTLTGLAFTNLRPSDVQLRSLAAAVPRLAWLHFIDAPDLTRESLAPFAEKCHSLGQVLVTSSQPEAILGLSGAPMLSQFTTSSSGINEEATRTLSTLPSLSALAIMGPDLARQQIPHLARLTRVYHFGLHQQSAEVVSASLEALAKLPHLAIVTLSDFAGTEEDLARLAQLPAMVVLNVTNETDATLEARLQEWQAERPWLHVRLNGKQLFAGIDFAAERRAAEWLAKNMTSGILHLMREDGTRYDVNHELRTLPPENFVMTGAFNIQLRDIDDAGLAQLAGCCRLNTLQIGGEKLTYTGKGLSWLGRNRGLIDLQFGNAAVVDNDLIGQLEQLPALQSLTFRNCKGPLDSFRDLPRLPALKTLSLTGTVLSLTQLPDLSKMCPNLQEIHLQDQGGCVPSITFLAGHPTLETVHCSSNQLSAEGVAALHQLPRLRSLHLHSPLVDPPDTLQRLSVLGDRLTIFSINTWTDWDVGPSDADYDVLLALPKLEEISLGHHKGSPSDRHLEVMARLPLLRKLTIGFDADQRRYTPAGLDKFRQARPDVESKVDGRD